MGVRGLTLPFYSTRLGLRAGLHYWRRMHVSSPTGRLKTSRREFCGGSGVSARPSSRARSLILPRGWRNTRAESLMMRASSHAILASLGSLRRVVGPSLALIAPMRTALVCFFCGDVFQQKCGLGWTGLTIIIVVWVFIILWTQIRLEIAQFWWNHFLS